MEKKLVENKIYSTKKPDIINFVSDEDFNIVLDMYKKNYYGKSYKEIEQIVNKPYPYNKYDWSVLLQIVTMNQFYNWHLSDHIKQKIKKVKLSCISNCECCKDFVNKEIDINDIRELPIKECPFEVRICLTARYMPVIDFGNIEINDSELKEYIEKESDNLFHKIFKFK